MHSAYSTVDLPVNPEAQDPNPQSPQQWKQVLPPDDPEHVDSAYSTVALPAHTDGNYFEDPPGLQIFHCLKADPQGGDTLLVDGEEERLGIGA